MSKRTRKRHEGSTRVLRYISYDAALVSLEHLPSEHSSCLRLTTSLPEMSWFCWVHTLGALIDALSPLAQLPVVYLGSKQADLPYGPVTVESAWRMLDAGGDPDRRQLDTTLTGWTALPCVTECK